MTRGEIRYTKAAYNCAVSLLRGFTAEMNRTGQWTPNRQQIQLDTLRLFERAIEHWHPTPDEEGDSQ